MELGTENRETGKDGKLVCSFVIPCFNGEPYLNTAVKSCFDQKIDGEVEVIVVDDASTDGTERLCNWLKTKYPGIVYHRLDKNVGRCNARNIGNQLAKSDIILVQDTDDQSLEKRAALSVDYLKNHPEKGLFYGSFNTCDFYLKSRGVIKAKEFSIDDVHKDGDTHIAHGAMAYRRELAMKFPYTQDGNWSKLGIDDWKLIMDMYFGGVRFGYTINPVYNYRVYPGNIENFRDYNEVRKLKEDYLKAYAEKIF